MDLNKIMIVVFMVAVVAGAGFAVYMIVGGDADDDVELAKITIKHPVEAGDYVTFYNGLGEEDTKYVIKEVLSNDMLKIDVISSGSSTVTKNVSAQEFYDNILCSKNLYKDFTKNRDGTDAIYDTEVLKTTFGNIYCNIYKGVYNQIGETHTFWVGSGGICYKHMIQKDGGKSQDILQYSSVLISDAGEGAGKDPQKPTDPTDPTVPETPSSSNAIKTPVEAGDNIEIKVTGTNVHTDKYTVKELLEGDNLNVELKRGSQVIQVTMTKDDFLSLLQPVLGGAIVDKSVTDTTVKYNSKDIKCTVYVVKIPAGDLSTGNFIKKQMWIGSEGVQYKSVSTLVNSSGATVNGFTETVILGTTNMIETSKTPAS